MNRGTSNCKKYEVVKTAVMIPHSNSAAPRRIGRVLAAVVLSGSAGLLASCAGEHATAPPAVASAPEARRMIDRSLPHAVTDRAGWTADLHSAFTALGLAPTPESICAVVAIIEQESGFQVDPTVPDLAAIAWREIDDRAAHAGVPKMLVHGVLQLSSRTGRSYAERIDSARTEKELSDIFEDFIAAVPLGSTLFADRNPIRTRGPMQVHVAFAEEFAATRPYPYPVAKSIDDEVFTRRGGLYFGIAHLLDYSAPYDRYLYRFADFNAGQFASRNAAFQHAVSVASGMPLIADGALVPHADASNAEGSTEAAVRSLSPRLHLGNDDVKKALALGKSAEFSKTTLYQRVFALADPGAKGKIAPAEVPHIELHGPKISRKLTTSWYANRVDSRFQRCLSAHSDRGGPPSR